MVHALFRAPLARYRWAIAARSVLAIFGGYLLAASFAACSGLLLARAGMPRVDAVTSANLLSFIVFACAAIWIFAGVGLRRATIGIVLGWLLYAVFFTGTLSYFLDEINLWMKPELHVSLPGETTATAAAALAGMQTIAPQASVWTLDLPTERQPTVSASWREKGEGSQGRAGLKRAELDAATGERIEVRETRGGNFRYRFHFELHAMPRAVGRWIVGIATMFMFVAIISGVITHKKIFTDFFTFRPRKGQRWGASVGAVGLLGVLTFAALGVGLQLTYAPATARWAPSAAALLVVLLVTFTMI